MRSKVRGFDEKPTQKRTPLLRREYGLKIVGQGKLTIFKFIAEEMYSRRG
jgi:hypothetical protein